MFKRVCVICCVFMFDVFVVCTFWCVSYGSIVACVFWCVCFLMMLFLWCALNVLGGVLFVGCCLCCVCLFLFVCMLFCCVWFDCLRVLLLYVLF